jgi:hypothetical protein
MFEDSVIRTYTADVPAGKPVLTSREVELSTLRFLLNVKRMSENIATGSGPGLLIREHIFDSSADTAELVQKASTMRNAAKALKMYAEVLQSVHKIVHWLGQMETGGSLPTEKVRPLRDAGSMLAIDLALFIAPQHKPALGLNEKGLSDI